MSNGYHWRLSDSKSSNIRCTFLDIPTDLNSSVIWTFSILFQLSTSKNLDSCVFDMVPSVPIIIGMALSFIFYYLLSSLQFTKHKSYCHKEM